MNSSIDYTIPVWHPQFVHFPIALLLLAVVPAAVWCVTTDRRWLIVGWFMTVAGALGAVAAYVTGDTVKEQSEGVPIVEALVDLHEKFAVATLIVSLIAAALSSAAVYADRRQPLGKPSVPLRALVLVLAIAAAVLVFRTAHLGGLMVWGVPAP